MSKIDRALLMGIIFSSSVAAFGFSAIYTNMKIEEHHQCQDFKRTNGTTIECKEGE